MFCRFVLFAFIIASIFIRSASAIFSPGDILVTDFGLSRITQYNSSGTVIRTFSVPSDSFWTGAALMPDGNLVSAFRYDVPAIPPLISASGHSGFLVFRPDGTLVTTQKTPELDYPGSIAGDVTVFPDGTLAIADQFHSSIRLYTQTGTLVRTITSPSIAHPFGGALAADNTLWVADIQTNSLTRLREDGTILNTYVLGFSPGDIAIVPGDGSFWIPDINPTNNSKTTTIHHISSTGISLSSFSFSYPNTGAEIGIALANDGSLYLDVFHNATLYHYSTSGTLLDSFFLPGSFDPIFTQIGPSIITVIPAPAPEPASLSLLTGASLLLIRRRKL